MRCLPHPLSVCGADMCSILQTVGQHPYLSIFMGTWESWCCAQGFLGSLGVLSEVFVSTVFIIQSGWKPSFSPDVSLSKLEATISVRLPHATGSYQLLLVSEHIMNGWPMCGFHPLGCQNLEMQGRASCFTSDGCVTIALMITELELEEVKRGKQEPEFNRQKMLVFINRWGWTNITVAWQV